jgi:hypothetical protein
MAVAWMVVLASSTLSSPVVLSFELLKECMLQEVVFQDSFVELYMNTKSFNWFHDMVKVIHLF